MRWLGRQKPIEGFTERQVDLVQFRLRAGLASLLSSLHLRLRGDEVVMNNTTEKLRKIAERYVKYDIKLDDELRDNEPATGDWPNSVPDDLLELWDELDETARLVAFIVGSENTFAPISD